MLHNSPYVHTCCSYLHWLETSYLEATNATALLELISKFWCVLVYKTGGSSAAYYQIQDIAFFKFHKTNKRMTTSKPATNRLRSTSSIHLTMFDNVRSVLLIHSNEYDGYLPQPLYHGLYSDCISRFFIWYDVSGYISSKIGETVDFWQENVCIQQFFVVLVKCEHTKYACVKATHMHISVSKQRTCTYLCQSNIHAHVCVKATYMHMSVSKQHTYTCLCQSNTHAHVCVKATHMCQRW